MWGEGKRPDGNCSSVGNHACAGSQLLIPVCLVRHSPDLGKERHQQIGICTLNLEVCAIDSRPASPYCMMWGTLSALHSEKLA